MTKRLSWLIPAALLMMVSCSSPKARISGSFAGCDSLSVFLEQINPVRSSVVDTVRTNSKGRFKLTAPLPSGQATLYNLRCRDENITLLLSPGENVEIYSIPGMINGYTIKGSEESALIKEVKDILNGGAAQLDSIMNAYSVERMDEAARKAAAKSYMDSYYRIKRQHIQFIIENSKSLAAVYALYQRLPNDDVLFNGDSDIVYYQMVADSVATVYPDSPYLRMLLSDIERSRTGSDLLSKLNEQSVNPLGVPEIEMTDIYGMSHRLSDLKGKVVLLDFWSISTQESPYLNAELKDLYSRYSSKGFEIYQISVDTSKPMWVSAVLQQKLPWITVCDFRGANSPTVRNFAISSVPSNFLINRDGDIVSKNLYGDDLELALKALLE